MLDFRRLDRHHDAGGAAVGLVAPVVIPENAKRLSHGLEKALRCDLDRMLDCASRHVTLHARTAIDAKIAVSCFVRYGNVP